jgi:hypothetical protein
VRLGATIKNALVLLAVVLLNSISFAGHTSAMPSMSHEMGSIKHGSSDTTSCATFCPTAVINKEDNIINDEESEDDTEPASAFYSQNQTLQTDEKSLSQHLYATEIKPPPKTPIYILYGVFRV